MNSGTNASGNPSSYKVTTNTITLADPSRSGYTFNGWTGSNGSTPQKGVQITKGSTGNKSYTANWTYSATPSITRNDYNTFTASATAGSQYFISTSQTTAPSATASGWSTTASKDVSTSAKETWYVWVKDANGNVSANSKTITNYKVTLSAGAGTTLTAKADSTSGANVTSGSYVLAGTPVYPTGALAAGYNTLVVKNGSTTITNSSSQTVNADTTFSTSATANELTFSNQTLAGGIYGTAYTSGAFTAASNGTGSYKYEIVSGAPTNATLNGTDGANRTISFTNTTAAGTYNVVVKATDKNSGKTKNATMTIVIDKAENPMTAKNSTVYVSSTTALTSLVQNNSGGSLSATITTDNTSGSSISSGNFVAGTLAANDDANKTVTVSITADTTNNYSEKTVSVTVTVQKYTNALSWASPTPNANATLTYGTSYTAKATAATNGGTNGTITYSSNNTAGATVNSSSGAISVANGNSKSVTITASMAGTTTVKAASTTRSFTTGKATNTISLTCATLTYTGSAQNLLSAKSASGGSVYIAKTSLTASNYSTSGSTALSGAQGTNADSYTVYAYTPGNDNYAAKSGSKSCSISKKALGTPGGLSVTKGGTISWNAVTAATGYQYAIGEDDSWHSAGNVTSINKLDDITATVGLKKIYVRAVNAGTNANSNYTSPGGETTVNIRVYKMTFTVADSSSNYGQIDTSTYNVISGVTYTASSNKITIKAGNATLKTVTASPKTYKGYTTAFKQWSSTSGTVDSGAVTITASFTATIKTFTVVYNKGSGTGTMSNQSIKYNTSYTLTANAFTKGSSSDGYVFAGWDDGVSSSLWSNQYSSTWKYDNGQYGITNDTLTLTAKWKRYISCQNSACGYTYASLYFPNGTSTCTKTSGTTGTYGGYTWSYWSGSTGTCTGTAYYISGASAASHGACCRIRRYSTCRTSGCGYVQSGGSDALY